MKTNTTKRTEEKLFCLRCGKGKIKGFYEAGCSVWGSYYKKHLWGKEPYQGEVGELFAVAVNDDDLPEKVTVPHQPDQTSDWREEFEKKGRLFSMEENPKNGYPSAYIHIDGKDYYVVEETDFIQSLLDSQEQRHQREMKCILEDLKEVRSRIKIPSGIFAPKDYPYENGFLAGVSECMSKVVNRLPDETTVTTNTLTNS